MASLLHPYCDGPTWFGPVQRTAPGFAIIGMCQQFNCSIAIDAFRSFAQPLTSAS